jgi:sulfite reductase alpha subunit-like flavoprotein
VITQLFVAFSRDQEKKHYVQHEIEKNGELMWKLIEQEKAVFIVSGRADNMPKDVRNSILKLICDHGGLTYSVAEKYVAAMEQQGRYLSEVW